MQLSVGPRGCKIHAVTGVAINNAIVIQIHNRTYVYIYNSLSYNKSRVNSQFGKLFKCSGKFYMMGQYVSIKKNFLT